MEKFNTKRFAQVLKWDFMNDWKYNTWLFLIMIVVFTCMLGLVYFNSSSDYLTEEIVSTGITMQATFCNFILSIIILAGASRMFNPLKNKQSATAMLSLPATNLEKFISRFVNVIVLWIVLGCAAFLCADALQMILAKTLGVNCTVSGSKTFFSLVPFNPLKWANEPNYIKFMIGFCLCSLLNVAIYMLGGILFRRRQFWVTTVIIFAISVIGTITIVNLGMHFEDWIESHIDRIEALVMRLFNDKDSFINSVFYCWWAITGLLTALLTWLTYRFFKRAQVINNKFLNV